MVSAPLLLFLGGCSGGILEPHGPVGAANVKIIYNALAIMLVIVAPTIAATLAFAWWFRETNQRAQYRPDWVYSGQLEVLVWAIPLLIIMFLGGVIWTGSHDLDPYKPIASERKAIEIQVVSLDWKWLFIYPDYGIATINEMFVPVGTPAHFSLTSATVMNSFFVPQLGSMIATMNGMVTQLHLQADRSGDYYGQSTQFSGDGFSGMHFTVHAVAQDEFARWLEEARNAPSTLDRNGYLALLQESQYASPSSYRDVEPGLFQAIATQQIPPGPGPSGGDASTSVRPKGSR
jgi:cytochrome o ubiquinol oxidase subunit 2